MRISLVNIVSLSTLFFLVACSGPVTKDNIRKAPRYSKTVSVDIPYQKVFANMLANGQTCYLSRPADQQLTFVGQKDLGKKTANITMEYIYAMAEHDVILMADLVSVDETSTNVTIYTSDLNRKADVGLMANWAIESNQEKTTLKC